MTRRKTASAFLLLTALTLSCDGPPVPGEVRLAVVAVDGATWDVMSPLLQAGRLPHIEALYRHGSAGVFKSVSPLSPAPVWTSVATGRPAAAHGITTEVVKIPGQYAQRPVTADTRRLPALWSIVGAQGVTVGVTGWPVTFPAEQVNGFMITDAYGEGENSRGTLWPDQAFAEDPADETGPALSEESVEVSHLDTGLAESFDRDLASLTRSLSLMRVYQPRVSLFRFGSIDYASHRFWQYHDRSLLKVQESRGLELTPERAEQLARVVPGAYEFFDEWVGMLMKGLPEGTTLFLVSGYGQRGARVTDAIQVDMNGLLSRLGLLVMGDDGRPDWPRTRAFNLPDGRLSHRGIWLNLAEREASGAVSSADAAATATDVITLLENLATSEGVPLFRSVTLQDRRGEDEPDIRAIENPDIDPMGIIRIGGEDVEVRTLFRRFEESLGAHDETGLLMASGPGIVRGKTGWEATLYDLLPTLLYLLGLPLSDDLPGTPVEELLAQPVSEDYPRVESYHDIAAAPDPLLMPPDLMQEQLQRLETEGHL